MVKEDLFYQLLKLHGIDLSQEARAVINGSFKKGDKINYNDVMPVICIDIETAAINKESKWIVRNETDKK